jgi:hypothetical protein
MSLLQHRDDYLKQYRDVQAIRSTEEFQAIEKQIAELEEKKKTLIGAAEEELELCEQALIKELQAENLTELEGIACKTRKVREVDVGALLRGPLGGDIDNLMLMVNVKQKSLEDFIDSNPDMAKELRTCIVDRGVKVTAVLPLSV